MTMTAPAAARLGRFAAETKVPAAARRRAQAAWLDTIGVMLAGAVAPPSRIVQQVAAPDDARGDCVVAGTARRADAGAAALANGTAAHALDFDDMCFVSMAHPSAPLVAASLAAGELARSAGGDLLDAYVVGFEVECALGRTMNPSHYARGWHCTSTLGTVGAAAAVARLFRLDAARTAHAIAIAASEACGLKANFGTMVKPLHVGVSARNAVLAGRLAAQGFTAADGAIDGPQGFVAAFSDGGGDLAAILDGLGSRWEIVETGVTVKLYPSCAATHPTLDAILDLRREHGFTGGDVRAMDVRVDAVTPGVLIHPEPRTGLEAKFSMQFCAAAAAVLGHVDVETFDDACVADARIRGLASRVTMRIDDTLGRDAPSLTQAHVRITLEDGRELHARAEGARGYPERPASRDELDAKFRACARRALTEEVVEGALGALHRIEDLTDARQLTGRLIPEPHR